MITKIRRLLISATGLAFVAAAASLYAGQAMAACYCTCMNGQNQPICDTAYEVRPICPPRVCPIVPPSVRPIQPPTVPPIGTQRCVKEQVWDHNFNKYVWKTVCR